MAAFGHDTDTIYSIASILCNDLHQPRHLPETPFGAQHHYDGENTSSTNTSSASYQVNFTITDLDYYNTGRHVQNINGNLAASKSPQNAGVVKQPPAPSLRGYPQRTLTNLSTKNSPSLVVPLPLYPEEVLHYRGLDRVVRPTSQATQHISSVASSFHLMKYEERGVIGNSPTICTVNTYKHTRQIDSDPSLLSSVVTPNRQPLQTFRDENRNNIETANETGVQNPIKSDRISDIPRVNSNSLNLEEHRKDSALLSFFPASTGSTTLSPSNSSTRPTCSTSVPATCSPSSFTTCSPSLSNISSPCSPGTCSQSSSNACLPSSPKSCSSSADSPSSTSSESSSNKHDGLDFKKFLTDKKTYTCPHCPYVTDRKNNLKRHVVTMHEKCDKTLECCNMPFANKALLRAHVVSCHKHGYNCLICGRIFCRKALLKRHVTVHNGQKDYRCSLCGYATSHKSNLDRHRRRHVEQGEGCCGTQNMIPENNELTYVPTVGKHYQNVGPNIEFGNRKEANLIENSIEDDHTPPVENINKNNEDNMLNYTNNLVTMFESFTITQPRKKMAIAGCILNRTLDFNKNFSDDGNVKTSYPKSKSNDKTSINSNAKRICVSPYKCQSCDIVFESQMKLLDHTDTFHESSIWMTRPLTVACRRKRSNENTYCLSGTI